METYQVINEPNWLLESLMCLVEPSFENEEQIVENCDKFGMNKEEMSEYLYPVLNYKKHVLQEIAPIASEYPKLKYYMQNMHEEMSSVLPLLVIINCKKLSEEQSDENIDKIFNNRYSDYFNDFFSKDKDSEVRIENIADVISYLTKVEADAEFKVRMIELYNERHNIWKLLINYLEASKGICEKYFELIEEEFTSALRLLQQSTHMNALFESTHVLEIDNDKSSKVTPCIFDFNKLVLCSTDDEYVCYVGIFVLTLIKRKKENEFNDKNFLSDLKALGDETRLKIIQNLTKQKMYNQELASVLQLTSATVSHHINILLQSRMVLISVDSDRSKKIYYEVNIQKLRLLSETIKSLTD